MYVIDEQRPPRRSISNTARAVLAIVLANGALASSPAQAATNTIVTIAGTGTQGFSGDGGPATAARLRQSHDVAVMPDGGFVFTDFGDNRVRRVTAGGIITTLAGTGSIGTGGDGGPAIAARFWGPTGVAVTHDGSVLIADSNNRVVRRVAPDGTITKVAGTTGVFFGPTGDGGPATAAILQAPQGVTVTPDGGFLIADASSIRKVSAAGIITTVAGTGSGGFSGDGGPAVSAQVNFSSEVALTGDGGFLIADANNFRIRRVSASGIITTVAGTGSGVFSGDGGPALSAGLNSPRGVDVEADGSFVIAETGSNRVRRVSPDGRIRTIAGNGGGLGGTEGGLAIDRGIGSLSKVTVDPDGDILIPGSATARVFRMDAGDPYVPDTAAPVVACGSADTLWHAANVSIACTASDTESGLADPADAAFTLSTHVPAGDENADASSGTHPKVCDVSGNCTGIVGPILHNKIDRRAPSVSCGAADTLWHATNVSIACAAGDAGAGLANLADAAFALSTSVPSGSEDANAATGGHAPVCDIVGNCSAPVAPIAGNRIDRKAPAVVLTRPANGANYSVLLSGVVKVAYECSDGGSGMASCSGPLASDATLDTSVAALGRHTFTVTAEDAVGNTAVVTHTYLVTLLGLGVLDLV